MIEYKMSIKFIFFNILFSTIIILFIPIFGLLLILSNYHASGTWSEYYWVKPTLFSIPIVYFIISLFYLILKKIKQFIFFLVLFVYVSLGFFMWNHDKETFNDFKIVFSKLAIKKLDNLKRK